MNLHVVVFVGNNLLQWGMKLSCCTFFNYQSSCFDNPSVIYILLKNVFPHIKPIMFKKMHSYLCFPGAI